MRLVVVLLAALALAAPVRHARPAPWLDCHAVGATRVRCEARYVWHARLLPSEPAWELYVDGAELFDRGRGLVVFLDRPKGGILVVMRVRIGDRRFRVLRRYDAATQPLPWVAR